MAKPEKWDKHSSTTANVDLEVSNNGTWMDAFQFGEPEDTTWSLDNMQFELDVQRNPYDASPLLSLSTNNGRIIVDDVVQRVIHFDVDAPDLQSHLPPGKYVYDLVMIDVNNNRVPLMFGSLKIIQGVTYPP